MVRTPVGDLESQGRGQRPLDGCVVGPADPVPDMSPTEGVSTFEEPVEGRAVSRRGDRVDEEREVVDEFAATR